MSDEDQRTWERPGDREADQLADDIAAERSTYESEALAEWTAAAWETGAPAKCPECGYDLKSDGYPIAHQRDPDGRECAVRVRL